MTHLETLQAIEELGEVARDRGRDRIRDNHDTRDFIACWNCVYCGLGIDTLYRCNRDHADIYGPPYVPEGSPCFERKAGGKL